MEKIKFQETHPIYTEVLENNKKRRVRYFGEFRVIDAMDKVKVITEDGYYFIKNEPVTIYTNTITAVINEATAKKNLTKKQEQQKELEESEKLNADINTVEEEIENGT